VSKKEKLSRLHNDNGHAGANDSNTQQDQNISNNRAVMHRTFAYSLSYLLTWGMTLLGGLYVIVGASISETGQIISGYFYSFLHPLQGLFTLLIYMHPQVVHEKRNNGNGNNNNIS